MPGIAVGQDSHTGTVDESGAIPGYRTAHGHILGLYRFRLTPESLQHLRQSHTGTGRVPSLHPAQGRGEIDCGRSGRAEVTADTGKFLRGMPEVEPGYCHLPPERHVQPVSRRYPYCRRSPDPQFRDGLVDLSLVPEREEFLLPGKQSLVHYHHPVTRGREVHTVVCEKIVQLHGRVLLPVRASI